MSSFLILGSNGFLGTSLADYLEKRGNRVIKCGRYVGSDVNLNLKDSEICSKFYEDKKVSVIINLVAKTDVDMCESEFHDAMESNSTYVYDLVKTIMEMKESKKPHIIHISTDHIYSGVGPHRETSLNPLNIYALSKIGGEIYAQKANATILRVNFIGMSHSPNRKSFSDWVVESLKKGTPITVFEDVLISPLNINTLCRLIELVTIKKIPGIFNLASSGGVSKAHIARQLCVILGLNCNLLINGLLGARNSRIKRPLDMRMNAELFERVYNFQIPSVENEVELTANEYLNDIRGKL